MIDLLENRRLFSIAITNRVLTVTGTGGVDTLYAAWNNAGSSSTVRVYDGTQSLVFTMASGSFDSVSLYGGAGNDTLYAGRIMTGYKSYVALLPVAANGGAGADTLYGSDANESLYGGSSDDELYANGGDDFLYGDGGADLMVGGAGLNNYYAAGDSAVDTIDMNTGYWDYARIDIVNGQFVDNVLNWDSNDFIVQG